MKRSSIIVVGLSSAALIPSLLAADKTFTAGGAGSGAWNVPGNWSPSGLPTSSDKAIIPGDKICNVDITTAVAGRIDVDGTLNVQAGKKLTVGDPALNVGVVSTIDGAVNLDWDNTNGPGIILFDINVHTVQGDGRIRAEKTACEIQIGVAAFLTNQLAVAGQGIRGSLTIKGLTSGGSNNGTFINSGLVHAADVLDALLVLHADTILDDDSTGLWAVDDCRRAVLRFDRQALGLDGDFWAECQGTLRFNASIKTCSDLVNYAGTIDIENSSTFQYVGFSGAGGCGNPGSGCGGNCQNPCTVSADTSCGCSCP